VDSKDDLFGFGMITERNQAKQPAYPDPLGLVAGGVRRLKGRKISNVSSCYSQEGMERDLEDRYLEIDDWEDADTISLDGYEDTPSSDAGQDLEDHTLEYLETDLVDIVQRIPSKTRNSKDEMDGKDIKLVPFPLFWSHSDRESKPLQLCSAIRSPITQSTSTKPPSSRARISRGLRTSFSIPYQKRFEKATDQVRPRARFQDLPLRNRIESKKQSRIELRQRSYQPSRQNSYTRSGQYLTSEESRSRSNHGKKWSRRSFTTGIQASIFPTSNSATKSKAPIGNFKPVSAASRSVLHHFHLQDESDQESSANEGGFSKAAARTKISRVFRMLEAENKKTKKEKRIEKLKRSIQLVAVVDAAKVEYDAVPPGGWI
jgi:hypothetical protein